MMWILAAVCVGGIGACLACSSPRLRAWLAAGGLRSEHAALRRVAVRNLAVCGEPGLRRLARALAIAEARNDAAELLISKGAIAAPILIEQISTKHDGLRDAALEVLRRLGESATEDLISAYTHPDNPVQRQWAGRLLAQIGGRRAVKTFIDQTECTDPAVRCLALEHLQSMNERAVVKVLVGRLNNGADAARSSAARLLGALGYSRSIEPLLVALQDPSEGVRAQAAVALAQLKAGQAVVPITELLSTKGHARNAAVRALGDLRDRRAAAPLRAALEEEKRRAREIQNRIQSQFRSRRSAVQSAILFELHNEQREAHTNIQMIENALHKLGR